MKTIKLLSCLALAAIALSCAKEIRHEQISSGNGITQINASFADTKTVLGSDGTSVLWSPNDEICVFYNGDGVNFRSINSVPKATALFLSSGTVLIGTSEDSSRSPYLYGVYPYSAASAQDDDVITLTVPSSQTAVEGSFGCGAFPSVGRSKSTDIAFYNVCGGMRFTLYQSGIRKIVMTGNNDETLAGKVKVQFDESGKPQVSAVVSGEKSITLTAPDNGEFQTGKWYYISVLPTTFSKSGFSVEFIKRTDELERGTKNVTSAVEVKRSIFGSVENIDSDVIFKLGVASLSISPAEVLVAPMSAVQLSLTILPSEASYEWIKWSSSDKTIATVDEDGVVSGKKDGKCTITATSDNSRTASCTVYVSQTPVTTNAASDISYYTATLNGTFNISDAESISKTVFFLYSDTESTIEGLKTNGTKAESSLSGNEFKSPVNDLKYSKKYYYAAAVTFLEQTYYGEVENFTTQSLPKPQTIDLGLSVKWASFNVGASKPEEYGHYFAWGDIVGQTRDSSSWSGGGFSTYPEYKVDANNNLKPEYDAAHVLLGGSWRMPTKAEQEELINNCTSTWTDNYEGTEVAGIIFISKKEGYTDKSIFLPAAGHGVGSHLPDAGSAGYYWSSTLDYDINAWCLCNTDPYFNYRSSGQSVRSVSE